MQIKVARYLPTKFNLNRARKYFEYKSGLELGQWGLFLPRHLNILAVLGTPEGKLLVPASNIVTDAGDVYYAQKSCGETPTNAFNVHTMCSAGTPGKAATLASFTVIAGSTQANDGTYPKTTDADADNTGAGTDIVTHRVSYTKASFTAGTISHGLIAVSGASGSAPLLTGYAFAASFSKTADDTLKVFVNHQMNGV